MPRESKARKKLAGTKLNKAAKVSAPLTLSRLDKYLSPEKVETHKQLMQLWHETAVSDLVKHSAECYALLFTQYNISPDDDERWFKLATCLAFEHVPAFRLSLEVKAGRPATWTDVRLFQLYLTVSAWMHDKKRPATEACKALYKHTPWSEWAESNNALYKHYMAAKSLPAAAAHALLKDDPDTSHASDTIAEDFWARHPLK